MAFPQPSNPLARAASQAQPLPADPTPPGDTQDPAGQGQANDAQIITAAAANDPVIAAIARILGVL